MLRKASEAISEGNVPIPQQEAYGSGQPTLLADAYRRIKLMMSHFEEQTELLEKRLTRLEHGARQPRLAMEADGQANTKTRERTESAVTAIQAMHEDSCTTEQKVQDGPKTSITFGREAEPPDLPCREDVLVEDGDTMPKSCLPFLEMRSPTAAGGLVPTGKASTATEANFNQPPLRFCSTEETDLEANCKRTSTPYASFDSSSFWRLLAAPYCYRIVETKSRQNMTLIQAVHEVTSTPARFWDRGARWFVVRFYGLGQLVTSCSVFSEEIR